MKRALVILLGALLLALALTAGALAFLAATEGGTRFLAEQAQRFLPVRFTDVSGALLKEIRIGRVEYQLEDQRIEIEGLEAEVKMMPLLFENQLIVPAVSARSVRLTATGESADDGPPPALELPYMPLRIDVGELVVERLQIYDVFPMRVAGSASWQQDGLVVHSANVVSEEIVGTVVGRLGTGANPLLTAQVNWSLPGQAWGGDGRLDGRVDDFALRHVLRGYVSVDAEGRGNLSQLTEPFVEVRVEAQDLEFGDTAIRNIAGRASGTLASMSAALSAQVTAPGIAPFALDVVAYGPPVTGPLTLRNVDADALGGTQQAQGSVTWQDDVQVLLGGTLSDVSLDALWQELQGQVSAGFEFRYADELLGLTLHELSGTLNGRPVGGAVQVAQLAEGWLFQPFRLNVGRNRLSGSARLSGNTVAVEADLQAPALQALGLAVAGDAAGTVRLSGTWPELNGQVALTSSHIEGFGVVLDQARIQASLDDGVLEGALSAGRAVREQLAVEDARLRARGPLQALDWRLTWQGGAGAGAFTRLEDGFELRLAEARMELLDQPWTLRDVTRVTLQDDRVEVSPTCISGGGASACVQSLSYAAGRLETRGELERAPVALLTPWLPVPLGDAGYLEGRWALAGQPDDLAGELALAARRLSYVADEEQAAIDLPDLEATGTVADGVLQMRLAATDKAFSVVGNARLTPVEPAGALSGSLVVSASDLAPLKVFDQRLEQVAGRVQGNLDVTGTLTAPRLEGRVVLADGRLKLNDPDVQLSDIGLVLSIDDSGTFQLRGSVMQDDNEVTLAASGTGLFQQALTLDAILEGERLEARHPDWEITVSPNLSFAYAEGRGRLRGRVEVPEAEVRFTALPTSVPSPSEDVVVIGRDNGAAKNADTNRFRADVEVVLGEDVVLKALGITAQLEGSLRARLDGQGRTTLRGTLDITEGELTTQGQTLEIESGTVAYNGPVTRPYIDLRAVRVIEDTDPEIKVGVHIRGDANNLTSSVFSDPVMSETRALSYLVLGRDIDQETAGADSSQLVAAAINLGLSRSKGITRELMRMTGLDELSAMAEAQNSFAIVAGKRVTDDLYVRYTYNTLSAVGAFLVRYELTRRWQLEAHSGEQSAMDLMYSVEK